MSMLLNTNLIINICSPLTWSRPYPWWYFTIFSFQCFLLAGFFGLASFGRCSPKTDSCLVASSVGGSLSFLVPSSSPPSWPTGPATLFLYQFTLLTTHLPLSLVFFWPAILTPRYPVSGAPLPLRRVPFWPAILPPGYPVSGASLPLRLVLFWPAILTPGYPVSGASLPLRRVFFWPAILTPGYPVSGASLPLRRVSFWPAILPPGYPVSGAHLPLRHDFFLAGYLDAQVSVFRYPSPAPPQLFPTGYFTAQVSLSRYPRAFFFAPYLGVLHRLFWRPSFFPTRPSLPGFLGGRLALCAALRYACGFYRSAIFTAPRFLPLPGFYRPAVFTAPRFLPLRFRRFFFFLGGLCSFATLMLAAPRSSPTSGRSLWCRLVRSVSGGPPFLILFLYRLIDRSRDVPAHLAGFFPFVHFIHIRGPSIVSSFECRDTGTTCTTTSLMGPFGYRKLGNLTYHRLL